MEQEPVSNAAPIDAVATEFKRSPIDGTGYDREFKEHESGKVLAILHLARTAQHQKLCDSTEKAEEWIQEQVKALTGSTRKAFRR